MAVELAWLYAATLTIVYFPVAAFLSAVGWLRIARFAGIALLPMPLLLVRGIGALFDLNKRPTLADDVAFLLQDQDVSIPLFAGLAVAGVVFSKVAARPPAAADVLA